MHPEATFVYPDGVKYLAGSCLMVGELLSRILRRLNHLENMPTTERYQQVPIDTGTFLFCLPCGNRPGEIITRKA